MLPKLARLQSTVPHRGRWSLTLCSLVLFAMPTWFAAAQSQAVKPPPENAPAGKQAADTGDITDVSKLSTPQTPSPPAVKKAPTTRTAAPASVEFLPQFSEKERIIVHELDGPTSFDFTDESLDGVRETIMERHGFDIIIEKDLLEGESIATDATDLSLKVNEIPLRSALKLLLRTKALAFVIEDDVLKIMTRTAYQTERLTRTYPVRDLVGDEAADFLLLMDAIRGGVAPSSWQEVTNSLPAAPQPPTGKATKATDSACTISMVPASGSLVIRQSWQGHDEVLKLLRALRKAKSEAPKE